jgi:CheY-like chemotaxis protein
MTQRIREIEGQWIDEKKLNEYKKVPIIAMTANTFKEDIKKCLNSGMNDHIGKPVEFNELIKKLINFLT